MGVPEIRKSEEKSLILLFKEMNKIILELDLHDIPRFWVIRQFISKSETLFDGLEWLEELAEGYRSDYVNTLSDLLSGKITLEKARSLMKMHYESLCVTMHYGYDLTYDLPDIITNGF